MGDGTAQTLSLILQKCVFLQLPFANLLLQLLEIHDAILTYLRIKFINYYWNKLLKLLFSSESIVIKVAPVKYHVEMIAAQV